MRNWFEFNLMAFGIILAAVYFIKPRTNYASPYYRLDSTKPQGVTLH